MGGIERSRDERAGRKDRRENYVLTAHGGPRAKRSTGASPSGGLAYVHNPRWDQRHLSTLVCRR